MREESKYTVCTRCFTYNQSQYIEDALNGFVMQETSFPVVYCIVDDASTDNTPIIIRHFFNKSFNVEDPDVAYHEDNDYGTVLYAQHRTNKNCFFAVLFLKENHYSQKKSKVPYLTRWMNSSYISLCEGDDYWTDPFKLQKQVTFMDLHPECILTVHAADWRTGDDVYPAGCQDSSHKVFSVDELIRCGGLFFATASFVFRQNLEKDRPEWRRKANVGDFPLQILASIRGEVHYLPDKMCVYRYLGQGSWTSSAQNTEVNIAFQKNKIEWMKLLDEETCHKYQKAIYDQLFQHYHSLFTLNEIGFVDYLKATHRSGKKRYGRVLKDFLRVEFTPIYDLLVHFRKKK